MTWHYAYADWNKIADHLDGLMDAYPDKTGNIGAAIALCRRMASGELVERSVLRLDLEELAALRVYARDHIDKPAASRHVCGVRGFADSGDTCPGCAPPAVTSDKPYGHDMLCTEGGEWLGPYGECKTDHAPPAATKDEREHCERSAYNLRERPDLYDMRVDVMAAHIQFERAAVRAECQAEIERLRAESEARLALVTVLRDEVDHLGAELASYKNAAPRAFGAHTYECECPRCK